MSEFTLDDLASESAQVSDSGGSAEETGKWLKDFYEQMRDDGYLDPLMKQFIGETRDMNQIQNDAKNANAGDTGESANTNDNPSAATASDLSADTVKNLMLELYDNADMIPGLSSDPTVSELIKLIDANPDMADQLIQEHL